MKKHPRQFRLLFAVGLVLCALSPCQAQNAPTKPTLPTGPLLKSVPDFTQWTIVRKGAKSAGGQPKPSADAVETISGQKTGDVVHVITVEGNGDKAEMWQKGNRHLAMRTGWKGPVIGKGSLPEFPELDWISRTNFTEFLKIQGRDCMVFRAKIFPSGGDQNLKKEDLDGVDPETLKVPAVATVDLETQLPVAMQIGDEVSNYKFEAMQPVALELPPAAQAAIAAQQQGEVSMRKPVRP